MFFSSLDSCRPHFQFFFSAFVVVVVLFLCAIFVISFNRQKYISKACSVVVAKLRWCIQNSEISKTKRCTNSHYIFSSSFVPVHFPSTLIEKMFSTATMQHGDSARLAKNGVSKFRASEEKNCNADFVIVTETSNFCFVRNRPIIENRFFYFRSVRSLDSRLPQFIRKLSFVCCIVHYFL